MTPIVVLTLCVYTVDGTATCSGIAAERAGCHIPCRIALVQRASLTLRLIAGEQAAANGNL